MCLFILKKAGGKKFVLRREGSSQRAQFFRISDASLFDFELRSSVNPRADALNGASYRLYE